MDDLDAEWSGSYAGMYSPYTKNNEKEQLADMRNGT